MSWLAPLFLAGLAAIALPIWLHRLQTETPQRQRFSSAMLLLQAERRMHVQKRLRYWLLLALRILFLCLLAFAFAKPLWQRPPALLDAAQSKLHVLLLDSSMSMQQGTRWQAALAEAEQVIAKANAGDRLEVVAAGDELQLLAGPVNGNALINDKSKGKLRNTLASLKPGASQLQYGAMINGLDTLLSEEHQATVVHVISDFQASGLPAKFSELVPITVNGRTPEVQLHATNTELTANWAINSVQRNADGITVTVQGYHTPATTLTVQLWVNGSLRNEQNKPLAADATTTFDFTKVALNTGSNKVEARIKSADSLPADDRFFAVMDNSVGQPVAFLSMNPAALAAKYVNAAYVAAGNRYALQPIRLDQFDARTLSRYRFVIIDDLGAVSNSLAAALEAYLQTGGAVLAAVGERALTLKSLPLVNLRIGSVGADQQDDRMSIGAIDLNHPALSHGGGLRSLNLTRYLPLSLDSNTRALVQLDNGAPLLLEQLRGAGHVLVFASSLDNTWNDLPVQPVFVSLLTEAARYLSGETQLKQEQRVGNTLSLAQTAAGKTVVGQIIDPLGKNLLTLSDAQQVRSVKLESQGFYEVVSATGSSLVAVNSVLAESDLQPMSADEMNNWQAALKPSPQTNATKGFATAAQKQTGLELWHWLLILMVMAVLAESLLGNTYLYKRVEAPT